MKTIAILAVLSVVSAKKLTLRSAKATEEAGKPCDKLRCPAAWRPKPNHHTLTGATSADCCDKTCELFQCVGAYRANEAYFGNVGSSPQICCDMMCGKDFQCDVGYVLGDATAPGVTKKDCCKPKCELFNCTAPYAPSAAKKDVVSSKAEDCCEITCAAFNCSIPGWAPNKTKDTEVGQSAEECCTPLCGNSAQVTCKAGFAVKEENVNKTSADIDEDCCAATCESWTCSDGLAPNTDKESAFAASDEECCLPTCKQFECSIEKGWAPWPAVADDIGDNATKCCLPTCKQFECGEGFLPYSEGEKDNVTSQSNTACCKPACESYSCSAAKGLMKVPNAKKVGGDDDKVCCESKKCEKVRNNMTALEDKKFCNGLDKEECVTKYTKSESGAIVMCKFHETYGLCRYDVDAAISDGCTDV